VTTRIAQAIETVQGLLFGVRTGQLNDTYPELNLDADDFDEEWKWIGSYANWRAAMLVFLYPENLLMPSLRKWQTPAFHNLVDDLRASPRLSAEATCLAAKEYSDYFRDVCSLSVDASCQALTRLRKGTNCLDETATGYRNLVHLFGLGEETNTIYWSTYDPKAGSDYPQTFWDSVPGIENVAAIVGAVPYQLAPDQRYIFLFALVQNGEKQELVFNRYDLEKGLSIEGWRSALIPLPLPSDTVNVVTTQREIDEKPPELRILTNEGLYRHSLNQAGTNWESEGFFNFFSEGDTSTTTRLHFN
jgi:hypothetical protein